MLTAVVSGGSRGIGRAIVERLAADGLRVHFLYREREDAANEVESSVGRSGGEAYGHRCDVTDRAAVESFLAAIDGERVWAVVNNAATLRDGHLLLMDEDRWEAVLDTVLTATYRLTRGCLRIMLREGGGRVVNIGSLSGLLGQQGQANYAAAKGGVAAMGRALAREVGRYRVTVNTVVPGWIETDMLAALPAARRARAVASVPMQRFGCPAEVAQVVSWLVSERSAYVTGTSIRVDGGVGA